MDAPWHEVFVGEGTFGLLDEGEIPVHSADWSNGLIAPMLQGGALVRTGIRTGSVCVRVQAQQEPATEIDASRPWEEVVEASVAAPATTSNSSHSTSALPTRTGHSQGEAAPTTASEFTPEAEKQHGTRQLKRPPRSTCSSCDPPNPRPPKPCAPAASSNNSNNPRPPTLTRRARPRR